LKCGAPLSITATRSHSPAILPQIQQLLSPRPTAPRPCACPASSICATPCPLIRRTVYGPFHTTHFVV
jgi:hypothetical protein